MLLCSLVAKFLDISYVKNSEYFSLVIGMDLYFDDQILEFPKNPNKRSLQKEGSVDTEI